MQAREAKSKMGEHLQLCLSSCNDCIVSAQKGLRVARTKVKALKVGCTNEEEASKKSDLVVAIEAEGMSLRLLHYFFNSW